MPCVVSSSELWTSCDIGNRSYVAIHEDVLLYCTGTEMTGCKAQLYCDGVLCECNCTCEFMSYHYVVAT